MTSETSPADPRIRSVPGAHNLRDLGGLRTSSGAVVRPGRIFRSDFPAFAAADVEHGLSLRTVVDLRRGNEAEIDRVDWAARGVECVRWPLTAGGESSWRARYSAYLSHLPATVVGAVRTVMAPDRHAVLFHCAAGKDRTGVVAALLLALLGVAEEDIVADYVLSAASVGPVLERLMGFELYAAMLSGCSVQDQEPRAEHMRDLLAWLADRGGAEAWLTAHGLPESEISAFRTAMLVDERGEPLA